ncbi:MAG: peptidylprolyl isomerase [Deltaproteobacteria bacterium]|nr:MAG: peptidylprolyl isomerase [Deltaproteobacteria bacterium]
MGDTELQGARALVRLEARRGSPVVVLLQEGGRWRIDFRATAGWHEADPGPKDPGNRPVSLDAALDGLTGDGPLVATLETTLGSLRCRLFPERAPLTVANFVALARGLRGFVDPKTASWTKRPFYDGLTFHRAIAGGLAQTGDPTGSGRGGPGYELPDELDATLRFDRAGILAMASRGPNTNGSQVFVTARPLPELDGRNTVFGVCDPVAVVDRLTRAPTAPETDRPVDPPRLLSVTFGRGD